MSHSQESMTDYSTEKLTPRERELLKQLIDAEARIRALESKVGKLEGRIRTIRKKSNEAPKELKASLRHAQRQLATYYPAFLSKEEWAHIQELRGKCE